MHCTHKKTKPGVVLYGHYLQWRRKTEYILVKLLHGSAVHKCVHCGHTVYKGRL